VSENSVDANADNFSLAKGDLKTSLLPLLIGIPAGVIATYVAFEFPNRGFFSAEYYVGVAFELQLVILISSLFCLPLALSESKRFKLPFKEMCFGIIFCDIVCCLMAYGHGYFPLLLIFFMQWLWMCYFWPKKNLPAFRYSIWLVIGAICGSITGSIITSIVFFQ
jgi:hypothetical protein